MLGRSGLRPRYGRGGHPPRPSRHGPARKHGLVGAVVVVALMVLSWAATDVDARDYALDAAVTIADPTSTDAPEDGARSGQITLRLDAVRLDARQHSAKQVLRHTRARRLVPAVLVRLGEPLRASWEHGNTRAVAAEQNPPSAHRHLIC